MFHASCTRDFEDFRLDPACCIGFGDTVADFSGPEMVPPQKKPLMLPAAFLHGPSPNAGPPTTPMASPSAGPPSTPQAKVAVAPSTPVGKKASEPASPQKRAGNVLEFGSPPLAPRRASNRLLKCLQSGGLEQVRACLALEPEAISKFFFDCDFMPVMCCAVRLACSPAVVQLLLRSGADASAAACEKQGYSPLTCLASLEPAKAPAASLHLLPPPPAVAARLRAERLQELRKRVQVARLLIEAGAHPKALDSRGRCPATVARATGNAELALFLEHYLEVQGCATLWRAQAGLSPMGGLNSDLLQVVCKYLLPSDLLELSSACTTRSTP